MVGGERRRISWIASRTVLLKKLHLNKARSTRLVSYAAELSWRIEYNPAKVLTLAAKIQNIRIDHSHSRYYALGMFILELLKCPREFKAVYSSGISESSVPLDTNKSG
jgi:hypothetical protein